MKRKRYRTSFFYDKQRVEIRLVPWSDAPGLSYVWVGTRKGKSTITTMDLTLDPRSAVAVAKAILAAAGGI